MPSRMSTRRALHLAAIIIVALLVVANMCLIYLFSSESRQDSASRSQGVTFFVATLTVPGFDEMPPAEQDEVVHELHGYVRKAAHFLEFALLGFLSSILVRLILTYVGRPLILWQVLGIPAVYCLLVAISDEVYQIFSNRGASPKDVCIDFCGAVCGVLFLHLVAWVISRVRNRGKEGAAV